MRALVVDDDPFMLSLLELALHDLGVDEVRTAQCAADALTLCDKAHGAPDLVLCDLNMPDMDGIEFLRHLAARHYTGSVVLISGSDGRVLKTGETIAAAHKLNILGSLAKPITREALQTILDGIRVLNEPRAAVSAERITAAELRAGIEGDQLVLHYQPKVSIGSRQVIGVEALVRWHHPSRGIIGPNAFIPVAEDAGLIDELTDAVLSKAIHQAGLWQRNECPLKVAINLSMDNLKRLELPEFIVGLAADAGVDIGNITVEVTETRLMSDVVAALEILTRLRLKGIELSIDDFGTGYSTMEQLQRVPFTELKIDQTFVSQAVHDPTARTILDSTVVLAQKLDMFTVAEGVETQEHWDMVAEIGCDYAQGYFIAKPMPGPMLPAWLGGWNGLSANLP
jgi:EAL domain-containing protein (putative c-di-GMP-specific phosphodiesterase class I)